MRHWVNRLTFAAIGLTVLISLFAFSAQYEWINGSFGLANYELAYADTKITLVYTDLTTNKQLSQTVLLIKGRNSVVYSLLVPENDNPFTLTYHLNDNTKDNVMRVGFHNEGALNQVKQTVPIQEAQPLTLDSVKRSIVYIVLRENTQAYAKADQAVESLINITKSDDYNAVQLIKYVLSQNEKNPPLLLRWLMCRADIESELFVAYKDDNDPGQLMNALFLEGQYYYVNLSDGVGALQERNEFRKNYSKLIFEMGVDR